MVIEGIVNPEDFKEEIPRFHFIHGEKMLMQYDPVHWQRFTDHFLCRPAGCLLEYFRNGGDPLGYQQKQSIIIHREGGNLPPS